MKLYIFESSQVDPYDNLAMEEHLFGRCDKESSAALFLWQNRDSVILGRNQNPYTECDLKMAEEEGVKIARRMTGGGAVFHDLGNLNFTFIAPKPIYRQEDAFSVIKDALMGLGIDVQVSGRNDLLAGGYKFSGNAFYSNETSVLHHGTILVHTDLGKMNRCLGTSNGKMKRKGIASVHSRVVNLCEMQPSISVPAIKDSLKRTYIERMGRQRAIEGVREQEVDSQAAPIDARRKYASRQWIFGSYDRDWDYSVRKSFPWGGVTLSMQIKDCRIEAFELDSDALLQEAIGTIKEKMVGVRLDACIQTMEEIEAAFDDEGAAQMAADIRDALRASLDAQETAQECGNALRASLDAQETAQECGK